MSEGCRPPAIRRRTNMSPARLDIYHNLFKSVAEEMGVALMRTSFSPNIKERRDFSCALFDGRGRMVVQGEHLPVHLGSMPLSVESVLSSLNLEDGDTAIVNDPYRGGTHLPDITFVTPVFERGSSAPGEPLAELRGASGPRRKAAAPLCDEVGSARGVPRPVGGLMGRVRRGPRPVFFVASRAHHADVGGMSPGSMPVSREIYQEGLVIPPTLLVKRGKMDHGVLNLFLANVRTPDERAGDILAQLAANELGRRRLVELLSSRGKSELTRASTALEEYAERMMRGLIASLPRGKYRFADFLDDDGVSRGPLKIECELTVSGGGVRVDFTGTSAQAAGCVNAPLAVTVSAVMYVFRTLLAGDVPSNYGSMLPIEVKATVGSLLNPRPPAPVAAGNVETSQRVVDVVYGALAKVRGLDVPAASSGTMNNLSMGGVQPRNGEPFTYYETMAGGMGARPGLDGLSAVHTHMTNTMNTPVEVVEKEYPLRVTRYAVRRRSGGRGRRKGGEGLVREIELLSDAEVSVLSDRRVHPPYGLKGGGAGKTGLNTLVRGSKRVVLPSKTSLRGRAGDRLRIETPGGGGYGKPRRRGGGALS